MFPVGECKSCSALLIDYSTYNDVRVRGGGDVTPSPLTASARRPTVSGDVHTAIVNYDVLLRSSVCSLHCSVLLVLTSEANVCILFVQNAFFSSHLAAQRLLDGTRYSSELSTFLFPSFVIRNKNKISHPYDYGKLLTCCRQHFHS